MIKRLEIEAVHAAALNGDREGLLALTEYVIAHDRKALYANMLASMFQDPENLESAVSAASRTRLNEWINVPCTETIEFDEVRRMVWTADHRALVAVKQRLLDEFDSECEYYDDIPF